MNVTLASALQCSRLPTRLRRPRLKQANATLQYCYYAQGLTLTTKPMGRDIRRNSSNVKQRPGKTTKNICLIFFQIRKSSKTDAAFPRLMPTITQPPTRKEDARTHH